MNEPPTDRVVPVLRYTALVLGGVTALLLVANPATRWYARERRRDDPDYPDDIPLLFDFNTEATIPTWFSACLLLAVAGVCVLLVAVTRAAGGPGERRWTLLALVFTAMSLDETVALHERLGSVVTDTGVGGTGVLTHPWVVAGLALGAAVAVAVAWAVATLPPRLRTWVTIGLGFYVGGALGIEAVSGAVLDAYGDGLAYAAVTWAEEAAEMVGAVVLCCALLAALHITVHDRILRVGLAESS